MTVKQFLKKHVEDYLFKDLRTITRIRLRRNQKVGGVSYPMASSILAGMELLGGLLQTSAFESRGHSKIYFENYWDNYFSVYDPQYLPFKDAFWYLIRCGISHTYLTKTGIVILRDRPQDHLKVLLEDGNYYLIVDLKQLFEDFVSSYNTQVKPIVWQQRSNGQVTKQSIQQRVDDMIGNYENDSNRRLSGFAPQASPITLASTLQSGASIVNGPNGPMGTVATYSGMRNRTNP